MAERVTGSVYLITGANRGIGLALVADVAAKQPDAFIYAGTRDTESPSSAQLKELAKKYLGRIEVVKYVAADKEGNKTLAKEIMKRHGRVDTAIANAGISNYIGKVHKTPILEYEEHFSVNVLGPLILFQSVYELLKASPLPRFIPISSGAGSMVLVVPLPIDVGPYGVSKAALNWATRKIHFENEWLIAFPLCPGGVDTDMADQNKVMDSSGMLATFPLRPANVTASMLVNIITGSTREKEGGQFVNVEGERHPW